jgi:hypothetical protein
MTVIKKRVKDRSVPLALGSAFHDLAATCYLLDTWNEKPMVLAWPKVLKMHFEKNEKEGWTRPTTNEQLTQAYSDGERMIRNLFSAHTDILVPAFRNKDGLWVEHLITIEIAGIKIIGYIDMILPGKNGVVICDFKTSKSLPSDDYDESVSTYKDQLDLYALACRFSGIRVEEMRLIYPRLKKTVTYSPSLDGFNRQKNRVHRVMNFINRYESLMNSGMSEDEASKEAFPVEPLPSRCDWCAIKNECSGPQSVAEKERRSLEEFRRSLQTR